MTQLPTTFPHLLPGNATPLEMAFSGATGRLAAIPYPIREVFRWDTCPAPLLPWLAWEMSVDLWDVGWTEGKKRAMIRESFELHRHKGTLYAIEKYLAYASAPLVRAIVPPNKSFAGKRLTAEEKLAFLNRFPQIRVYRFRSRGNWTYGAFTRGAYKLPKTFLGDEDGRPVAFPYQSNAWERWGRRAFLWDQGTHPLATGEETPLRYIDRDRVAVDGVSVDFDRLLIPGSKVQSLFLPSATGNFDKRGGRMFPVVSAARTRIITIGRSRTWSADEDRLDRITTLPPSLEPTYAFPEHVAEPGVLRRGQNIWAGVIGSWLNPATKERKVLKGYLKGFLMPTLAPFRLYDRYFLHDKARLPAERPATQHIGHMRLGMPPFEAELQPAIRARRTLFQAGRYVYGFVDAHNAKPLGLVREAVVRAKAKRDKILLRTGLHRPVSAALGIRANAGYRSGGLYFSAT